jgi:hypothetical protein
MRPARPMAEIAPAASTVRSLVTLDEMKTSEPTMPPRWRMTEERVATHQSPPPRPEPDVRLPLPPLPRAGWLRVPTAWQPAARWESAVAAWRPAAAEARPAVRIVRQVSVSPHSRSIAASPPTRSRDAACPGPAGLRTVPNAAARASSARMAQQAQSRATQRQTRRRAPRRRTSASSESTRGLEKASVNIPASREPRRTGQYAERRPRRRRHQPACGAARRESSSWFGSRGPRSVGVGDRWRSA